MDSKVEFLELRISWMMGSEVVTPSALVIIPLIENDEEKRNHL
jgi:hypothetical protein